MSDDKKTTTRTEPAPQLVFVQIRHPNKKKNRADWDVRKQFVCTQEEYLDLPASEQANSTVKFVSAEEAKTKKTFDRSAEFEDPADDTPQPKKHKTGRKPTEETEA